MTDNKQASPLVGCEDQKSREISVVEGPCPFCKSEQELFSDELAKETFRCRNCGKSFSVPEFLKNAGH